MSPTGQVESDGSYTLTTYLKGDGAPAGEYAVTIYWPGNRKEMPSDETHEEEERLPPDRLKRVYATVNATELRATVRGTEYNRFHSPAIMPLTFQAA